tara:strand:- start:488 stop:847 length:360 start_codon:yes stop_codon:yes gene_type:complete
MASVLQFQTRFPEFCEEDDDRVQMFLDDAALNMSSKEKWIDWYDVAHQYLAAHFLVAGLATESGDYGVLAPLKKQEVDDVVIEQAVESVSASMDDLYSTAYGKRYITYRKRVLAGPRGV